MTDIGTSPPRDQLLAGALVAAAALLGLRPAATVRPAARAVAA